MAVSGGYTTPFAQAADLASSLDWLFSEDLYFIVPSHMGEPCTSILMDQIVRAHKPPSKDHNTF